MIAPFLAFLAASVAAVHAAGWQQQLTPLTPDAFAPLRPIRASYRGGWTSFSAAEIEAEFSTKGDVAELSASGCTTGFVRTLWRIDFTHVARAQLSTLRPLEMKQVENYRGRTLRTELQFDRDGVVKFREATPAEGPPSKRKRFDYPGLFDLQSAFLFIRSQKLRTNDVLNIVVYPSSAPYLATVRVLGREKVQAGGSRAPAIKLDVKLQRIDQQFELQPHQKFKRATAWISDDPNRLLLKVQADIFVGTIWAELASVKFLPRTIP
ncbi:MAG: hypothetical protein QOD99_3043 [Chthoniobacter sp.]|nr:hypothetical protein [Chthoniobacter sp.]